MEMIIILWMLKIVFLNFTISLFTKRKGLFYCGLVGFSGTDNWTFDRGYINMLLYYNSIERNSDDSTGVYTPESGVVKTTQKAKAFIVDYTNKIEADNILIGHVRSRTVGWATQQNAHPFEIGRIVLAHNGTLDNAKELCDEFKLNEKDYNVDSQVLCAALQKTKNADVLKYYGGAAAVLFTDTKYPDVIYAYRDGSRTLFRGTREEGMYISSNEDSLKAIGCEKIKEFKENYLYTIENGSIKSQIMIPRKPIPVPPKTYYPKHTDWGNELGFDEYSELGDINKWGWDTKDLEGHLLLCDTDMKFAYGHKCSFRKGEWYKCTRSVSGKKYQIYVEDDNNDEHEVLISIFSISKSEIQFNKEVIFARKVISKSKDIVVALPGEIATALIYNAAGNFYLCELTNKERWEIPAHLIRPRQKDEIMIPTLENAEPLDFEIPAENMVNLIKEVDGQIDGLKSILKLKPDAIDLPIMQTKLAEGLKKLDLLTEYLIKEYDLLSKTPIQNAN